MLTSFETGFRRSKKGNLWREYDGKTLSVFPRSDDTFGWCIASGDDNKQFSSRGYETEEEAIEALGRMLDVEDDDY